MSSEGNPLPGNDSVEPVNFFSKYDRPDNQNQEVNLRTYIRLQHAQTPDEIRKLFDYFAEEDGGYGLMMPNYDKGVVAQRDGLLKQLEDYLLRQVFKKMAEEPEHLDYVGMSMDEGIVVHKDAVMERLDAYVKAGSME